MTEEQYDEWVLRGRLPHKKSGEIDAYAIERAMRNITNSKRRLGLVKRLLLERPL